MKQQTTKKLPSKLSKQVGKALVRSGRRARQLAHAHGASVYFTRNGKIVAEKP